MSFIDLTADLEWTDADITNRTEAMVRSVFPATEETILNRNVWALSTGKITDPEQVAAIQATMASFEQVGFAAQVAGIEARADMALLRPVLQVERGELASEELSPEQQALLEQRAELRAAAISLEA